MVHKAWFREQMQLEAPRSFEIREISYEQILAFWREFLWPDRPESLRPMSTMLLAGGFDMEISTKYQPLFLGLFEENALRGVISGHASGETEFRLRGLCVHPKHRGRGLGPFLLRAALETAAKQGAAIVWSYPRDAAWSAYQKVGFLKIHRKLRESDKNCYAVVHLAPDCETKQTAAHPSDSR